MAMCLGQASKWERERERPFLHAECNLDNWRLLWSNNDRVTSDNRQLQVASCVPRKLQVILVARCCNSLLSLCLFKLNKDEASGLSKGHIHTERGRGETQLTLVLTVVRCNDKCITCNRGWPQIYVCLQVQLRKSFRFSLSHSILSASLFNSLH